MVGCKLIYQGLFLFNRNYFFYLYLDVCSKSLSVRKLSRRGGLPQAIICETCAPDKRLFKKSLMNLVELALRTF